MEIDELYEDCNYVSKYFLGTIIKKGNRKLTKQEIDACLIPKWISVKKAFDIFSKHNEYKDIEEMKRGLYLREYTALKNIVPLKKGEIVSFEIINLHISGMRYVNEYEIIMKDGKVEVSKYGFNHSNNEKKRILEKSKECTKEQILKLINDCHLMSWDGFYGKHPKGVRDGTMFNFNAIVNGNRHITASGSQNFPKNYKVFVQWIYELFN